ncbi:uncharacterized protein PFL1_05469 [Pseudozyma flocculosa PF-1]|uniref:HIG1 domain-containing protein n=2 Tax=Pseudozyma flocculosa TaxID=84751 RepID=A0A5C3FD64_9BASI|nr:uncharacterized protein PFL1_05469 [Pseudozyma flocculosa PF-1]EPQ26834.1 hypothetical protein PFL1_05469 [Pseudozyma flocculosa PF-1]SPO42096.1 uncharacterized protein PSFLO_07579 [Pseudozyma flocculosa]
MDTETGPAPRTGSTLPSATTTSSLGGAPKRIRHREDQIESAYEVQRNAAIKGAAIWTLIGATACFWGHHLFPGFRRQTLALKGFLTSGATIFGFVTGADTVLLSHEDQQRSSENLIRNRARAELGQRGIVASEAEIEKWKDAFIAKKLEERRLRRLDLERRQGQNADGDATPSLSPPPQQQDEEQQQ